MTVALDPQDVELLDRLARLEASNRSAELRQLLAHLRPALRQLCEALEAAERTRDRFAAQVRTTAAHELEAIRPDVERLAGQYLGLLARLEGAAAAEAAAELDRDPRSCNHGGHNSDPEGLDVGQ